MRPRNNGHSSQLLYALILSALCLALTAAPAAAAGPPAISASAFSAVTDTAAVLEGAVNTEGKKTEYHFEYISQADYVADGGSFGAGTHSAPEPEGALPGHPSAKGDLVNGSNVVTNLSVTGVPPGALAPGQAISGTGIPLATTIVSVGAGQLTLSNAATATAPQVTLTATGPQPVSVPIGGLAPGTAYRFRLLAHNSEHSGIPTEGPTLLFATYASPRAFGPCPNDALRTGLGAHLPDCRAYEQASSPDKGGGYATAELFKKEAALSGDAFAFSSQTPLPGTSGTGNFPQYFADRGLGNWSTSGIQPPPSFGFGGTIVGWTPDLAYSLTTTILLGSDEDGSADSELILRRSSDGSFQVIVPYTDGARYAFAGASADDSKIFFEAHGAPLSVTAGAAPTSSADNLYVYDRETGELRLVGVLPDSACASPPCAAPEGSFAGPYDWWSGTSAASLARGGAFNESRGDGYFTQADHAISASGDRVVFTAGGAGKIYERINPTAPPSAVTINGSGEEECTEAAKACTIEVSASRRAAPDPLGHRPATFMAASVDGSRVFFTSPEKLTDDANTGPEPEHSPAIARSGIGGGGVDLEFLPTKATGIAVFGEHIYWADPGEGGAGEGVIGRAKLNGDGPPSEPEPHFITGAYNPQGVAVDSEHVYWTNAESEKPATGTIGRATLDAGGLPTTVDQSFIPAYEIEDPEYPGNPKGSPGPYSPHSIAVDSSHIWWGDLGDKQTGKALMRATLSGGESTQWGKADNCGGGCLPPQIQLRHLAPRQIALDANYAYFAESERSPSSVYIWRQSLTDAFDLKLLHYAGEDTFLGVAVDGTHLYWSDSARDAIGRSDLEGEGAEDEFVAGAGQPEGIALDGTHLYWVANQSVKPNPGNDLYRYDAGAAPGHRLTDLTPDPADEDGAEVQGVLGASEDGSYVYFTANGVLAANAGARGSHAILGDCSQSGKNWSGTCNLYLDHEGAIEFIARLDVSKNANTSDAADWQPAGTPPNGPGGATGMGTARVSNDGKTLVFRSQERLSDYESEGTPEFYRYVAGTTGPVCLTCNPTGASPTSAPGISSLFAFGVTSTAPPIESRIASSDGSRFFFETVEKLIAADVNGDGDCPLVHLAGASSYRACQDVYEWEAPGSGTCTQGGPSFSPLNEGCLYLISSGTSPEPSFFGDASASGNDVFVFTADQLVPQDQDQLRDLYDARVEGGLASQHLSTALPCEGEACKQGASSPSLGASSPGTASFSGPGNAHECPKGKARRHGRCVVKRHHHRGRHHRGRHHRRAGK